MRSNELTGLEAGEGKQVEGNVLARALLGWDDGGEGGGRRIKRHVLASSQRISRKLFRATQPTNESAYVGPDSSKTCPRASGEGLLATACTLTPHFSLTWAAVVGPTAATRQTRPPSPSTEENARCSRRTGKANSADDGAKNTTHHSVGSKKPKPRSTPLHLLWRKKSKDGIYRAARGAGRVPRRRLRNRGNLGWHKPGGVRDVARPP